MYIQVIKRVKPKFLLKTNLNFITVNLTKIFLKNQILLLKMSKNV